MNDITSTYVGKTCKCKVYYIRKFSIKFIDSLIACSSLIKLEYTSWQLNFLHIYFYFIHRVDIENILFAKMFIFP